MAIIETIYTTPKCELLETFGYYFRPNNDYGKVEGKYFLYVASMEDLSIKLDVRLKGKHIWFCTSPYKLTIDAVWGGVDAERERHGKLWLYEYDPNNHFLLLQATIPNSFLVCEQQAKALLDFYNSRDCQWTPYDQRRYVPAIRNYRENHLQLINDGWYY